MLKRMLFCANLLALCCAPVAMASDTEDQVFTDPRKAGPDYAVQGEYLGIAKPDGPEEPWGAQVIALGGGAFRMVGYQGGLPGAGWQRGDTTASAEGRMADGVVTLKGDGWTAKIAAGKLTVAAPDGDVVGNLKKTARKSPTLGAKPPSGAIVLFDGSSADNFEHGKIVEGDLLLASCASKQKFGDHALHLEFRTPFKPYGRGQGRGNSGVYIQSRYEVQVLDSFGLEGRNNECGGIYSISTPIVNMCLPPLTWQTYDYDYTSARYDANGKKVKNARVTIRHNGVVIHDDLELTHGTPGRHPEGPGPDALYLQGHGNPVVYRNIWVVEK